MNGSSIYIAETKANIPGPRIYFLRTREIGRVHTWAEKRFGEGIAFSVRERIFFDDIGEVIDLDNTEAE